MKRGCKVQPLFLLRTLHQNGKLEFEKCENQVIFNHQNLKLKNKRKKSLTFYIWFNFQVGTLIENIKG
jgi:hypothetical protein